MNVFIRLTLEGLSYGVIFILQTMVRNRSNLYPTEEDLFISHPSTLPILSYKNTHNIDADDNINSSLDNLNDNEQDRTYFDNQIIPWRKLYSRKRMEDSLSASSLSPIDEYSTKSYLSNLLSKYNQWPILIVSSILISLLAIILDWSLTWLSNLKYGYCRGNFFQVEESCVDNWYVYNHNIPKGFSSIVGLIILLIFALIYSKIGTWISKFDYSIARSGISELKLIIFGRVNNNFLKPEIIYRKFISLIFICASGGFLLSFEGPLIHISCGVINYIIDKSATISPKFKNLQNEAIRREIISIGFVMGISLAFGAPIGGLLFSVEILRLSSRVNSLLWNGFVCSSIATFIFFKVHPFKKIEINDTFIVEIGNSFIFFETLPYMFVGFVCGFLAIGFKKLHMIILSYKEKIKSRNIDLINTKFPILNTILENQNLEVLIVVVLTIIMLYPISFSNLTLNNLLLSLFHDCKENDKNFNQAVCQSSHKLFEMFIYLVVLFFQSNYSYTLNIPGGILLPALNIGALIGRFIGEFVQFIQEKSGGGIFLQCYNENKNCVSPGSYAIVGAASFFAGVTNASVAAVVIVFEITGAVTYMIPLMLGVVVAKTILDIFDSKGFFELWLMNLNKNYVSPGLTETLRMAQFSEMKLFQILGSDYYPFVLYIDDDRIIIDELINKIETIYQDEQIDSETINDGFVILQNKDVPVLVGWISYNDLLMKLKENIDNYSKVSFKNGDFDMDNETLNLYSNIIHKEDLLIVNEDFTLLTAYDLMFQLQTFNLFVCKNTETGSLFKGIIRMSDLSNILEKN